MSGRFIGSRSPPAPNTTQRRAGVSLRIAASTFSSPSGVCAKSTYTSAATDAFSTRSSLPQRGVSDGTTAWIASRETPAASASAAATRALDLL